MAEQFNDARAERLRISGFSSESEWLKDRVGWQAGDSSHINDLWGLYMELQGFGGVHINDARFDWLASLGHNLTDQMTDREHDFWSSTEVLP